MRKCCIDWNARKRKQYFWKKIKSFETAQEAKDWYDKYMAKQKKKRVRLSK